MGSVVVRRKKKNRPRTVYVISHSKPCHIYRESAAVDMAMLTRKEKKKEQKHKAR